ncbi:hypothetical protein B566_EDAN006019 [Ephemera danica]|nr:hypothetical protein B566_EDAN006019 [Ephemera danica]
MFTAATAALGGPPQQQQQQPSHDPHSRLPQHRSGSPTILSFRSSLVYIFTLIHEDLLKFLVILVVVAGRRSLLLMGTSTESRRGSRLHASRGPLLLLLVHALATARAASTEESASRVSPLASPRDSGSRGLFAPRVEYDEWTPLGHGDPLKNDPTYDYVPPVLERVRYWIEPPSRAPSPPRVTSPTSSSSSSYTYTHTHPSYLTNTFLQTTSVLDSRRDTYPFLTLVDGPKFNNNNNNNNPPVKTTTTTTESPSQYLPVSRPYFSAPSPPYKTIVTSIPQILTPAPSKAPMTVTTIASALTTDPLFAHYKQPAEPIRGPMYLIIEGHSKVKTYGASKTIHGIRVNEHDSRRQSKRRRRRRKLRKRSLL